MAPLNLGRIIVWCFFLDLGSCRKYPFVRGRSHDHFATRPAVERHAAAGQIERPLVDAYTRKEEVGKSLFEQYVMRRSWRGLQWKRALRDRLRVSPN